jgi:hypothetical protein
MHIAAIHATNVTCMRLMDEMSERMPDIVDTKLQASLVRESIEASEKKWKLEEDIRTADSRNTLLIESAAQKDIEAYKKRPLVPKRGNELSGNLQSEDISNDVKVASRRDVSGSDSLTLNGCYIGNKN